MNSSILQRTSPMNAANPNRESEVMIARVRRERRDHNACFAAGTRGALLST